MINIPQKLDEKIQESRFWSAELNYFVDKYEGLYGNQMDFFPEYTDHSIHHINNVLYYAEKLIPESTYRNMTADEIAIIIFAILLHDIAMHTTKQIWIQLFKRDVWRSKWELFYNEIIRWSDDYSEFLFGDVIRYDPMKKNNPILEWNKLDIQIIGEFLRRNHGLISQEFCENGIPDINGKSLSLFTDRVPVNVKKIIGIVAYSHTIALRETFKLVEDISQGKKFRSRYSFNGKKILLYYPIVILRLADYLDAGIDRAPRLYTEFHTFNSGYSHGEWEWNQAIIDIVFAENDELDDTKDREICYFLTDVNTNSAYLSISKFLSGLQSELDVCWAVLGEIYGQHPRKLSIRRIESNLKEKDKDYNFVTQLVGININPNVSKLLVKPLYNNNPAFAIRELIQNSVDACLQRKYIEGNDLYIPQIIFKYWSKNNKKFISIRDNGIGMTQENILNCFLTIGSSYRDTMEWKINFLTDDDKKAKILRSGRFGIGVLANFLLGDSIQVKTMPIQNRISWRSFSFEITLMNNFRNVKINRSIDEPNWFIDEKMDKNDCGTEITIELNQNVTEGDIYKYFFTADRYAKNYISWYIYDYPRIDYVNITNLEDSSYKISINNEETHYIEYDSCLVMWQWDLKKIDSRIFQIGRRFSVDESIRSKNESAVYYNGFPVIADEFAHKIMKSFDIYKGYKKLSLLPLFCIQDPNLKINMSLDRTNITYAPNELIDKILDSIIIDFIAFIFLAKKDKREFCFNALNCERKDIGSVFDAYGWIEYNDFYGMNIPYFVQSMSDTNLYQIYVTQKELNKVDSRNKYVMYCKERPGQSEDEINQRYNFETLKKKIRASFEPIKNSVESYSIFLRKDVFDEKMSLIKEYFQDHAIETISDLLKVCIKGGSETKQKNELHDENLLINSNINFAVSIKLKEVLITDKLSEKIYEFVKEDLKGKNNYFIPLNYRDRVKHYPNTFQKLKNLGYFVNDSFITQWEIGDISEQLRIEIENNQT